MELYDRCRVLCRRAEAISNSIVAQNGILFNHRIVLHETERSSTIRANRKLPVLVHCLAQLVVRSGQVGGGQGRRMRDKAIYTTKEVSDLAAQYGRPVTQEYIRRLCKTGRIQAVRPSRDWLISASEAMRWLASWLKDRAPLA